MAASGIHTLLLSLALAPIAGWPQLPHQRLVRARIGAKRSGDADAALPLPCLLGA
jgi:hypothetical protein